MILDISTNMVTAGKVKLATTKPYRPDLDFEFTMDTPWLTIRRPEILVFVNRRDKRSRVLHLVKQRHMSRSTGPRYAVTKCGMEVRDAWTMSLTDYHESYILNYMLPVRWCTRCVKP